MSSDFKWDASNFSKRRFIETKLNFCLVYPLQLHKLRTTGKKLSCDVVITVRLKLRPQEIQSKMMMDGKTNKILFSNLSGKCYLEGFHICGMRLPNYITDSLRDLSKHVSDACSIHPSMPPYMPSCLSIHVSMLLLRAPSHLPPNYTHFSQGALGPLV